MFEGLAAGVEHFVEFFGLGYCARESIEDETRKLYVSCAGPVLYERVVESTHCYIPGSSQFGS